MNDLPWYLGLGWSLGAVLGFIGLVLLVDFAWNKRWGEYGKWQILSTFGGLLTTWFWAPWGLYGVHCLVLLLPTISIPMPPSPPDNTKIERSK